MNYLAHFYIDQQLDNFYYNTGLLLPDIAKTHVKSLKIKPPIEFNSDEDLIHQGCLRHYQSDKIFHASPFFEHYLDLVNQAMKLAPLSIAVQRKWFIAHVMVELMIDRVIVKHDPNQVDRFYQSFVSIQDEVLISFLQKFGATEIDTFMSRFGHFRSVKYIYYYADNNKFVYSLSRIMMRVGMPEPELADKNILEELCIQVERDYFSDPNKLFTELKGVFK